MFEVPLTSQVIEVVKVEPYTYSFVLIPLLRHTEGLRARSVDLPTLVDPRLGLITHPHPHHESARDRVVRGARSPPSSHYKEGLIASI